MQLQYRFTFLLAIALLLCPVALKAQKKALIIFPEDEKFIIPYTFVKNDMKGTQDSVPMKFLTLKYQFYNELTQRLADNNYQPIGGVNDKANTIRKYAKQRFFSSDSVTQANLDKKKYVSAVIDETNKNIYTLYANADSVDYIIFINKVDVGANIFRKWLATKNYVMDIHFDVYTADMKHIGGRYLRQKVRLTRDTYWSAFQTTFSALPEEVALYFVNMKK